MLSGLAYLHHYRFAHRDIKPENYMLETGRFNAKLKLIDFGLAHQLQKGEKMHTMCGTLAYVAPEVFGDGYDERCDTWSLGCTIFVACTNVQPFVGETDRDIVKAVVKGKPD